MRQVHSAGVIVFRNLNDTLEMLVLDYGNFVGHSKGEIEPGELISQAAIRELVEETRLSLLVISQEPVAEVDYPIFIEGEKAHKTVYYFAGVTNPHLEVQISEEHVGFRWIDAKAYKRIITYERDQIAVESALMWLRKYTGAAIKLSSDLEKLGF